MIFMANPSTEPIRQAMRDGLLGCITTPIQGNLIPDGALWCADNGAFGDNYVGDTAWLAWLCAKAAKNDISRCLFAVAPDVVGDAAATLERSSPFLSVIRGLDIPAAFVAQDGIEQTAVPWDEFDVLFIGGTDDFKLGPVARDCITQALSRGKRIHMGRVNGGRRWRLAQYLGCHSVDGTTLTRGPSRNLPEVLRWSLQTELYEGTAS